MPKDYIELKLKTPIDFSSVNFKKLYYFDDKIKVKHLDDVKMYITTRSEIDDSSVEEIFKQLSKDFLDKVTGNYVEEEVSEEVPEELPEEVPEEDEDYEVSDEVSEEAPEEDEDEECKIEYACNFSDPTIWDSYCDTALFFYSFIEKIDDVKIIHMELILINSKRVPTPDPIVCFLFDLDAPLNFKFVELTPSKNKKFNCSLDNTSVTNRYENEGSYVLNSLVDLSEKLLVELEKQYKVDYGDEKVNLEYTCNFDTPVVYEKFCNKAVFTVVRTEKIEDKTIIHLQLVLCKDKQYKNQYDDYIEKY